MSNEKRNSILIVDDQQPNLDALSAILSTDYTIYLAKSGKKAIEIVDEFLPDLILLDIIMPEIDGYELLDKFKTSPKTKHIPVIVISGLESPENEAKALSLDAADFIHKPFRSRIIKLRVRNHLQIINQIKTMAAKEEKNRLIGKKTHELKAPLDELIGLSEIILKEGSLNRESKEKAEKILNTGNRLMHMINDIIDISR